MYLFPESDSQVISKTFLRHFINSSNVITSFSFYIPFSFVNLFYYFVFKERSKDITFSPSDSHECTPSLISSLKFAISQIHTTESVQATRKSKGKETSKWAGKTLRVV